MDISELKENIKPVLKKMDEVSTVENELENISLELHKQMEELSHKIKIVEKEIEENRKKIKKNEKDKLEWMEIFLNTDVRNGIIDACKKNNISESKINMINMINCSIEEGNACYEDYEELIEYTTKIIHKNEINNEGKKVNKKKKESFFKHLKEEIFPKR